MDTRLKKKKEERRRRGREEEGGEAEAEEAEAEEEEEYIKLGGKVVEYREGELEKKWWEKFNYYVLPALWVKSCIIVRSLVLSKIIKKALETYILKYK